MLETLSWILKLPQLLARNSSSPTLGQGRLKTTSIHRSLRRYSLLDLPFHQLRCMNNCLCGFDRAMTQRGLCEHGILAVEYVTGFPSATVGSEVVVLSIKRDICLVADPTHYRSPAVRRECWRHEFVGSIESQPPVLVDYLFDLGTIVSKISELRANSSRKGRSMESWENGPLVA